MIEQKKKRQSYYHKREILSKFDGNPSGEDVLDYLLGDQYGCDSEYTLYKYEYSPRSFVNRLNLLWFYPLFFISIPFQWFFRGDIGFSRDSKIGRVVNKLVILD
jgi:hypothetical protein